MIMVVVMPMPNVQTISAAPTCICNERFEGDGQTCADVDECLVDNGGCNVNATVAITLGRPQHALVMSGTRETDKPVLTAMSVWWKMVAVMPMLLALIKRAKHRFVIVTQAMRGMAKTVLTSMSAQ